MTVLNTLQLSQINEYFYQPNSNFITIFGPAKSGKTTFMRDFIIKKNFLYLTNFTSTSNILFDSHVQQINKYFKIKNSSKYYDSFEKILSLIDEQDIKEKFALIIDNISELISNDKNALHSLIQFWKNSFKFKPIMLIILHNNLSDKELLEKYSHIMYLDSFDFTLIKDKPVLSATDKFYIYSIFGTSNYFLSFYSTKIALQKNVYQLLLQPDSPFYNYGIEYLKYTLSEVGTFASILYAIAIGNHKIGDIAKVLNCKSSYLTRYMQKLQDLMIIEKNLPLSKTTSYSKYGRYFIKDHLLRFWFCYVYPNQALLNLKKHTTVLKELDETLNKFILTPTYIEYIRKIILANPQKYLGYTPLKIGPWWDNNENSIDLIAYNNSDITFIKVLWENKETAALRYSELKSASDNFKTTLKKNYIIISKTTYLNSLQ